jgi:hypothetical protein
VSDIPIYVTRKTAEGKTGNWTLDKRGAEWLLWQVFAVLFLILPVWLLIAAVTAARIVVGWFV